LNEHNEERKVERAKGQYKLVRLPGSDEMTSIQLCPHGSDMCECDAKIPEPLRRQMDPSVKPWTDTRQGHMAKYGVHSHAICRAQGYYDSEGSCKDPKCFNAHENHIHVNECGAGKVVGTSPDTKKPISAMSSDELRKNYEDRLVAEVNSWTDQKRGYVYKLLNAQGMRVNDAEELIRKAKFEGD